MQFDNLRAVLLSLLALAVLAVLTSSTGVLPRAEALSFVVDDLGDDADFSTGDGVCDTDDSAGERAP